MGSYNEGKKEVCEWIRANFPKFASILDVGVSDGKWRYLLGDYPYMDGVEAFKPNAERVKGLYNNVFNADIKDFEYDYYDLVIFGDVIEHLGVEDAQRVLEYAKTRCVDMVVAVPFLYKQGIEYGNPYEIHKQDDLTREIFAERYPGFSVLFDARDDYCYYHWSPLLDGYERITRAEN